MEAVKISALEQAIEYERKLADAEKRAWLAESNLHSFQLEQVKAQLSTISSQLSSASTELSATKSQLELLEAKTVAQEQQILKLQSELKEEVARHLTTTDELSQLKIDQKDFNFFKSVAYWYQHFHQGIDGLVRRTIFDKSMKAIAIQKEKIDSSQVQPLIKAMESAQALSQLILLNA